MEPVMGRRIVFTKEDLAQLPEDRRAEVIEGDLVMIPAPDGSHQYFVLRLYDALRDHLGPARGRVLVAPADVELDDHNVLQPDVLVLPEGTKPTLHPWKFPKPVWVSEVLSPSTAKRDRGVKPRVYARFGIEELWLVDQFERTVEVRDLAASRTTVCREVARSRVLDGFELDVLRLFSV